MSETEDARKLIRFSWEQLILCCEYEGCEAVETIMLTFMNHVYSAHLTSLQDGDLHCHWNDCEAFTDTLPELRRHLLFHAHHTKIKCHGKNVQIRKKLPECALGSQNRNVIPELPEPFMCCWDDCQENFENAEYFYRHVDMHTTGTNDGKKPVKCLWAGCERTFPDPYRLQDHVKAHSQEKTVACPTCGAMFASRTKFLDHILRQIKVPDGDTDDSAEESFLCEYCTRRLQTERLLRDHMRIHVCHYKCPFCDMTCPTPSALRLHLTYRHSDEKPHACQYCDYKCKRQNDLRKHLETHSEVPTYSCTVEGCSYASRSMTCLNHHVRVKHCAVKAARYMCHICSKVTTRGNYLTKHLVAKHNFSWPSGHCRFRYRLQEDGFFRLQTVRYESLELSEAVLCESAAKENVSVCTTAGVLTQTPSTSSQGDQPGTSGMSNTTDSSKVPLTIYVENESGAVSVNTVELQGSVSDLVLVTPDGEQCGTITLQVVNSPSESGESAPAELLIVPPKNLSHQKPKQ